MFETEIALVGGKDGSQSVSRMGRGAAGFPCIMQYAVYVSDNRIQRQIVMTEEAQTEKQQQQQRERVSF